MVARKSPMIPASPAGITGRAPVKGSGGFCCQVPPDPACRSLTRQGFSSVFQTALRSLGNRSIVVVGNYEFGPITAEPCRAKARPLRPRRSYFAPADTAAKAPLAFKTREPLHWWRRRVLPPGPIGLLRRPFIAIAGLRRPSEYRREGLTKKDRVRPRRTPADGAGDSRRSLRQFIWPKVLRRLSLAPCPTPDPRAPRRRCSNSSSPS